MEVGAYVTIMEPVKVQDHLADAYLTARQECMKMWFPGYVVVPNATLAEHTIRAGAGVRQADKGRHGRREGRQQVRAVQTPGRFVLRCREFQRRWQGQGQSW
mgnify:CR=1 FL=1